MMMPYSSRVKEPLKLLDLTLDYHSTMFLILCNASQKTRDLNYTTVETSDLGCSRLKGIQTCVYCDGIVVVY
jgi:hypothetical protein